MLQREERERRAKRGKGAREERLSHEENEARKAREEKEARPPFSCHLLLSRKSLSLSLFRCCLFMPHVHKRTYRAYTTHTHHTGTVTIPIIMRGKEARVEREREHSSDVVVVVNVVLSSLSLCLFFSRGTFSSSNSEESKRACVSRVFLS